LHQTLGSKKKNCNDLKNTSITNNGVKTTNKSGTNTWINTTLKIKYNTISTNNDQGCKTKENKMRRIHELILSATRSMEQQQGRGVGRGGVPR
jgi:hypothetical protein